MTISDLALAAAAGAVAVAVLDPARARWTWALGGVLVGGWAMSRSSAAVGALLVAGTIVAAWIEVPAGPSERGFETLLGRFLALAAGAAGGVVLVVRVLGEDLTSVPALALLAAMAIAAMAYLLQHGDPREASRAARLLVVVAAAGMAVGGHPGVASTVMSALLLVAIAAAPRLEPAR